MKKCNKCEVEKEYIFFRKRKDSKDGFRNNCKECMNTHMKIYYDNNKEELLTQKKEYYEKNKDKIFIKNKKYYENNKEKVINLSKEYYENNKDYISLKQKEYHINNKDKRNKYSIEYFKNRLETDDIFKTKHYIKSIIRNSLKSLGYSKKSKTQEILGCSIEEFRIYLESKFEDWMTWNNRGLYNGELNYGWDVDHIIPLSSAKIEDEIIKLNHYTNLRPLCSYTNRYIKRNKIQNTI